jgi:hypothetical protein
MLYDSRNENFRIAFHADRITNNQHRTPYNIDHKHILSATAWTNMFGCG